MTRILGLALFSSLLVAACGGVARDSLSEGDETGGASNGGGAASGTGGKVGGGALPGTGGKVGGGAVPGSGGKAGGGTLPGSGGKVGGGTGAVGSGGYIGSGGAIGVAGAVCCTAAPSCNPGDIQVAGPFFCPAGTSCYEVNLCCQTIMCRRDPTCTAKIAPCLPGETQIPPNSVCPPGGTCYQRSICGNVVACFSPTFQDAGVPPDPGCGGPPPRGVHYVSTSLEKCALIDYACPQGTTYYGDDCGCGCRQSSSCPDYVDCMPGPAPTNPLCSDPSMCPYSIRAL